jgi:hypothetical protein
MAQLDMSAASTAGDQDPSTSTTAADGPIAIGDSLLAASRRRTLVNRRLGAGAQ